MDKMRLKKVKASEMQEAISGIITELAGAKYNCEILGIRYKGDEAQVRMKLERDRADSLEEYMGEQQEEKSD